MSSKNYYEILGIKKEASADEIKAAFRKKAMQYHPDKNQGNEEAERKFKEINEAYEILKDDQKRAAYDRFGSQAFSGGGAGGSPFGDFNFNTQDFGDFSNVFSEMFGNFMGGGGKKASSGSGGDLRYDITITLEEAFAGCKKNIKYRAPSNCTPCNGTGSASKKPPSNCQSCKGSGRSRMSQGFFVIEQICASCGGTGQTVSDPCSSCRGEGRTTRERNLTVTIPAGVENGNKIRIQGEGEAGIRGVKSGDLYVFVNLKSHSFFKVQGNNLLCQVPIKMTTAILGGTIEIPTVSGVPEKIKLDPGIQHGHKLTIKGKGMPYLNSSNKGNMIVEFIVEIPINLSQKQKDLIAEFDKEQGENCHPQSDGFFKRVKDIWKDLKK